MKLKLFFGLSVLLNTALMVALVALYLGREAPAVNSTAAPVPAVAAELKTHTPRAAKFDWRLVESEDYRQYIANLRSIGCPEETIRDIIVADVNKLFETRRQTSIEPKDDFKFWKAGQNLFATTDPDKLEAEIKLSRELAQEKRALIKELLGIDYQEPPGAVARGFSPQEKMLAFLPAEKRVQLMELEQKYNLRRMKSLPGGGGSPEDFKKIEAEKAADLAKILTPTELEEYEMRTHPTAMNLRLQLSNFDATKDEFRELFRARKKFDEEHGGFMNLAPTTPEGRDKKQAAERELQKAMQSTLGETRYQEYVRDQDWGYRSALQAVEKTGLPKETAVKVYDMKRMAEESAQKLRQDQGLSAEQREASLQALQAETERAISNTLGNDAYKAYRIQPGSGWLFQLAPPAAPTGQSAVAPKN